MSVYLNGTVQFMHIHNTKFNGLLLINKGIIDNKIFSPTTVNSTLSKNIDK